MLVLQASHTLQEVEEILLHEFGDDQDGLVARADRIQLEQLRMAQLLHDLSFREKVARIHRARLQLLDRHRRRVIPAAFPDLAELARADLTDELQRPTLDFPLVVVRKRHRLRSLHLNKRTLHLLPVKSPRPPRLRDRRCTRITKSR